MAKTLVIGLGNPILTDDGIGILTARAVAKALPPASPVEVAELSVGGLRLMESMVGYDRVVLIDAIKTGTGSPGQVYTIGPESLPDTLNTASAHDADMMTALAIGRALGAPLPADDDITIVAVEADDVLTFGDMPTPPVAAALPIAVQMVLAALAEQAELDQIEMPNGGEL